MNYNKPELIERLSAEYVLGTLHGSARARFETLMMQSYLIRRSVWSWEAQLNPLGNITPGVKAPRSIWRNIEKRIKVNEPDKLRQALLWWQRTSYAGLAASLVFGVAFFFSMQFSTQPTAVNAFETISVINNEEAQPQWLVSFDVETGILSTKALNAQAVDASKTFELWALNDNAAPQSLGLLPVNQSSNQLQLPASVVQLLTIAEGLAVSLEPTGGSPTGLPTGPVLYQAQLFNL